MILSKIIDTTLLTDSEYNAKADRICIEYKNKGLHLVKFQRKIKEKSQGDFPRALLTQNFIVIQTYKL